MREGRYEMNRFDERNNDKRNFPRLKAFFPIQYKVKKKFEGALSKDVSGGGIRFVTEEFIAPNTKLTLQLSLPDIAKPVIVVGRAAWIEKLPHSDKYSVGVEFMKFQDEDDRKAIEEYLDEKFSVPELVLW